MQDLKKKSEQGGEGSDKLKQVLLEFKDLSKKFDLYKDLDKKMSRMFKELDVNTILKQIKSKAEQDDVKKDLTIQDTKIKSNYDNITYLRKDVDGLVLLYKKLIQLL